METTNKQQSRSAFYDGALYHGHAIDAIFHSDAIKNAYSNGMDMPTRQTLIKAHLVGLEIAEKGIKALERKYAGGIHNGSVIRAKEKIEPAKDLAAKIFELAKKLDQNDS